MFECVVMRGNDTATLVIFEGYDDQNTTYQTSCFSIRSKTKYLLSHFLKKNPCVRLYNQPLCFVRMFRHDLDVSNSTSSGDPISIEDDVFVDISFFVEFGSFSFFFCFFF